MLPFVAFWALAFWALAVDTTSASIRFGARVVFSLTPVDAFSANMVGVGVRLWIISCIPGAVLLVAAALFICNAITVVVFGLNGTIGVVVLGVATVVLAARCVGTAAGGMFAGGVDWRMIANDVVCGGDGVFGTASVRIRVVGVVVFGTVGVRAGIGIRVDEDGGTPVKMHCVLPVGQQTARPGQM